MPDDPKVDSGQTVITADDQKEVKSDEAVQPESDQTTDSEDTEKTDAPITANDAISAAEAAQKLSDEELTAEIAKMKTAAECIASGSLKVPEDAIADLKNRIVIFEDTISSRAESEKEKIEADAKAVEEKAEAEETAFKSKLKTYGLYGGGITGWLMLVFLTGIAVVYIVR